MSQRIYLVRHGETDWNREGRAQGQQEVPLNERGKKQAQVVGKFLAGLSPLRILSSDLGRAMETAEIIGEACGLTVIPESALRERNMGPFEGKTLTEIREQRARDLTSFEGIPGVEQDDAILQRVLPVLEALVRNSTDDSVVVTHGGVAKVVLHHVLGITGMPRRFSLYNGLVIILLWNGEHFVLDGLIAPRWMESGEDQE